MNIRKTIIGLVAVALVASMGVSAQGFGLLTESGPDQTDDVVEGHTIHTEIRQVQQNEFAAAAVLIEEARQEQVLWFDDSFLHKVDNVNVQAGTLWATNDDGVLLEDKSNYVPVKTYLITTNSDAGTPGPTWTITKYETDLDADGEADFPNSVTRAWAVESDATRHTFTMADEGGVDTFSIDYNAFLWFEMGDLTNDGVKNYGATGADSADNTTEGNSHPYNPNQGAADDHTHDTANVNLYFNQPGQAVQTAADTFSNSHDFASFHQH